jgi:hypothetical protein
VDFDVLEKMINDDSISLINELWGELHYGHIINNLSTDETHAFTIKCNNVMKSLKERDIKGASNGGKLDKIIFNEF